MRSQKEIIEHIIATKKEILNPDISASKREKLLARALAMEWVIMEVIEIDIIDKRLREVGILTGNKKKEAGDRNEGHKGQARKKPDTI